MKSIYMIGSIVLALLVIVGGLFALKPQPRRTKIFNFFGTLGKGVKKYTVDLFKTSPKTEAGIPAAAVLAGEPDAIPA